VHWSHSVYSDKIYMFLWGVMPFCSQLSKYWRNLTALNPTINHLPHLLLIDCCYLYTDSDVSAWYTIQYVCIHTKGIKMRITLYKADRPRVLWITGLDGSNVSSCFLHSCLRASIVLTAMRTSVWIIPDAGLTLYWYCIIYTHTQINHSYHTQPRNTELSHLYKCAVAAYLTGSMLVLMNEDTPCQAGWLF